MKRFITIGLVALSLLLSAVVLVMTTIIIVKKADNSTELAVITETGQITEDQNETEEEKRSEVAVTNSLDKGEILSAADIEKAVIKYSYANNSALYDANNNQCADGWSINVGEENEYVVTYVTLIGVKTYYHVNADTGETYVTEALPGPENEEEYSGETFNIFDYVEDADVNVDGDNTENSKTPIYYQKTGSSVEDMDTRISEEDIQKYFWGTGLYYVGDCRGKVVVYSADIEAYEGDIEWDGEMLQCVSSYEFEDGHLMCKEVFIEFDTDVDAVNACKLLEEEAQGVNKNRLGYWNGTATYQFFENYLIIEQDQSTFESIMGKSYDNISVEDVVDYYANQGKVIEHR